jgi:hypothetical protein
VKRRAVLVMVFAAVALAAALGASPAVGDETADEPLAVQQSVTRPIRDEAAMVLVGTALIGLAAAVRRA